MIKIKEKLDVLKSVFKVVENLNAEVSITFKRDRIYIRVVHPSNHCLIVINIMKELFEEYEVKDEITYTLKIDLLNKILKKVGKKEICITTNMDGMIVNNSNEKFILNYYVGVEDERPLPDIKSTSRWKVKSDVFFKEIEELSDFSTICKLYGSDSLMITTKAHMVSGDVGIADAEKIVCKNEIGYYDISYVNNIKDIKSVFKEVIIGYGDDQPLLINGVENYVSFEFMLANRVEGDSNNE